MNTSAKQEFQQREAIDKDKICNFGMESLL